MKILNEIQGWYKLEAVKKSGEVRLLADWFPNLITDFGLNAYGTSSNFLSACQVGSGATPPQVTDTSLANRIAGSTSATAVTGAASAAPYYSFRRQVFSFAAGMATGNISEVGVGQTPNTATLFSRALILDSSGAPTTITVLSDEVLQVTYELRHYAPSSDTTGTLVLDGQTYTWTARAIAVTNPGQGAWRIPENAGLSESLAYIGPSSALVAVTANAPTGIQIPASSFTSAPYSNGSYQRSGTVIWLPAVANDAAGIGAIRATLGMGAYQIGFSPRIPKTANQQLTLTLTHSWGRRP